LDYYLTDETTKKEICLVAKPSFTLVIAFISHLRIKQMHPLFSLKTFLPIYTSNDMYVTRNNIKIS